MRARTGWCSSVRGGGHSVPGHSTCDDGLVLDLSPMRSVRVDPVKMTARAEGGVNWGTFDHETGAFGLASPGGQVSTTGIAGLTLGGGIGWLMRKHGLACDNLISADVVTAAGDLVTASADENEGLFWGLRGGGGNFGVVTSFEYLLHEVGVVFGGAVMHPADRAHDALAFYGEFSATAPDELTAYALLVTAPPAPFVPPDMVGQPVVVLAGCYAGDLAEGERVLKPLREFGSPPIDLFQPLPYPVLQSMFDETSPAGHSYYIKGDYVSDISDDLIGTVIEQQAAMPGAALRDPPRTDGRRGWSCRRGRHGFLPQGCGIRRSSVSPTGSSRTTKRARRLGPRPGEAVRPHTVATYVNFLGDEGDERVKYAYGSAGEVRPAGAR